MASDEDAEKAPCEQEEEEESEDESERGTSRKAARGTSGDVDDDDDAGEVLKNKTEEEGGEEEENASDKAIAGKMRTAAPQDSPQEVVAKVVPSGTSEVARRPSSDELIASGVRADATLTGAKEHAVQIASVVQQVPAPVAPQETAAIESTVLHEAQIHRNRAAAALGLAGTRMRARRDPKTNLLVLEVADRHAAWKTLAAGEDISAVCCVDHELQIWTRAAGKLVLLTATPEDAREWVGRLTRPPRGRLLRNVAAWPEARGVDDFGFGDIVMFRINQAVAGMQRAFTASPWDHTGIVVPSSWGMSFPCGYSPDQEPWMLLEATPHGVISCPLGERIDQYRRDAGARACVRQLRCAKDGRRPARQSIAGDLEHLVTACMGAPYSYAKVFNIPGTSFEYLREREETESMAGYFCSELCARALMCMRIMDKGKHTHPNAYWPKSFVYGHDIDRHLDAAFLLTPELPIDLAR